MWHAWVFLLQLTNASSQHQLLHLSSLQHNILGPIFFFFFFFSFFFFFLGGGGLLVVQEFFTWVSEVKSMSVETLGNREQSDLFKVYMEGWYPLSTLPPPLLVPMYFHSCVTFTLILHHMQTTTLQPFPPKSAWPYFLPLPVCCCGRLG